MLRSELAAIAISLTVATGLIAHSMRAALVWEYSGAPQDCTPVAEMSAPASWVRSSSDRSEEALGNIWTVTVAPSKTGYLCDDGLIYWR